MTPEEIKQWYFRFTMEVLNLKLVDKKKIKK